MIKQIFDNIVKYKYVFIIFFGIVIRLIFIGRIPGNYNYFQDEAFSAYEAYSLNTYGMDSHGYHNPIYLEVWGSGMSAVQCYCQIIFIKLLGFCPLAIRLPQALLACITLVFFYFLIKEISDEETAAWATFILAVCPWHLQMSRWGLDCNYFVGLITIAMYVLVTSRNKVWKTILAGICMGVALYGYAAPWIVMPVFVLGMLIFLYLKKEMTVKSIVIYIVSLGIVAFPLLLLVAINMGMLNEIQTAFFAIPKMGSFRTEDVSFSLANLKMSLEYFWKQYDWRSWNSTPQWGVYFLFSNVFLIIGLIKDFVKPNKLSRIMHIWFGCGLILSALVEACFNRLNILMQPLVYFIAVGIVFTIQLFKSKGKYVRSLIMILYGVTSALWLNYYFTGFNEMMERVWNEGAQESIEFAQHYNSTIHVNGMIYPLILCYSKYPVEQFVDTVEYVDEDAMYLTPVSFEGYDLRDITIEPPVKGDVYICSVEDANGTAYIANNNMAVAQFGQYYVGVAN